MTTHINSLAEFISTGRNEVDGRARLVDAGNGFYARITHPDPAKDEFGYAVFVKSDKGALVAAGLSPRGRTQPWPNATLLQHLRLFVAKQVEHPNKNVPPAYPASFQGAVHLRAIGWVVPEKSATRPIVPATRASLPAATAG